mgnify:CR=1 FL=1|jgi:large subunit ribosomal protein L23
MRPAHEILLRPRITEKGSMLSEQKPLVIFEVPVDANKSEIKNAVQSMFNVDVDEVRTMVVRGKIKRRGRFIGKRSNWKKAIVSLAEGQDLDIFGATAG